MRTNTFTITQTSTGFDVEVTFDSGKHETIEGLYDLDTALDFIKMHASYEDNKYV